MPRAGLDQFMILQAAVELADAEGLHHVSLKALADQLGVRPPSLYNHVKGLEDLHKLLMLYGWKKLEEEITAAVIGRSGDQAVRAMCKAYVQYASAHPGVFEAMQWYNQTSSPEAMQATERLIAISFRVLETYCLNEDQMVHTVRMLRSFLQGFVSLINNRAFGLQHPIADTLDFSIELFLQGIASMATKQDQEGMNPLQ